MKLSLLFFFCIRRVLLSCIGQQIILASDASPAPTVGDIVKELGIILCLFTRIRNNYTMVMLGNGKKLMPLILISKFELLLTEAGGEFLQIHRSFLVAVRHITAITFNHVLINKIEIPIGVQYKERFFKVIGFRSND